MTKVEGNKPATIDASALVRGRNPNAHCGNASGWIADRNRVVTAPK